jgi:hypothetical protein
MKFVDNVQNVNELNTYQYNNMYIPVPVNDTPDNTRLAMLPPELSYAHLASTWKYEANYQTNTMNMNIPVTDFGAGFVETCNPRAITIGSPYVL